MHHLHPLSIVCRWGILGLCAVVVHKPTLGLAQANVRGTSITMEAPVGATPAEDFRGFVLPKYPAASIMVTELPAPIDKFLASISDLSAAEWAKKGMTHKSTAPQTFGTAQGMLFEVTQEAQGIAFAKWIGVFGRESKSVMVTATYRQQDQRALREAMKQAVVSARLLADKSSSKTADVFGELPFALRPPPEGLSFAGHMGENVLFTKDGKLQAPSAGEDTAPMLIAGAAHSRIAIKDLASFARKRLLQTATLRGFRLEPGKAVKLGALSGYEVSARAEHDEGHPKWVYQLVVINEGRYFIVQGIVGTAQRAKYEPIFRGMAHSLRLK